MAFDSSVTLYEIAARDWLRTFAVRRTRPATFDDVPDQALDRIVEQGFNWVWLLGVWQTGAIGLEVSRTQPEWTRGYRSVLSDFTEQDVCGSPFAIQDYTVHRDFGGDEALARLRTRLGARGVRLMLDFVPNHTARDHPWVEQRPDYYVAGSEVDLGREPGNYARVETAAGPRILAFGRDPYFPGWPDTFQLNFRHPALRAAMGDVLVKAAGQCDGLRCDMAMLLLPEIFARTWGKASDPDAGLDPDDSPFWPAAIARVRQSRPDFLFLAEAYWDLEWTLQHQGFDVTYDKRLYDRLRVHDAGAVRDHLRADVAFQQRSARFLENHDEPRAAAAFVPREQHLAAATVTYLAPGLRLFHQGQLEGATVQPSVHLARRPLEPVDEAVAQWYRELLTILQRPELQEGRWSLCECRPAWHGNQTWEQFLAFAWDGPGSAGESLLIAVNYGPTQAQCYLTLPPDVFAGKSWVFRDLTGPFEYRRSSGDLIPYGLYLDLPPWRSHVFEVRPTGPG